MVNHPDHPYMRGQHYNPQEGQENKRRMSKKTKSNSLLSILKKIKGMPFEKRNDLIVNHALELRNKNESSAKMIRSTLDAANKSGSLKNKNISFLIDAAIKKYTKAGAVSGFKKNLTLHPDAKKNISEYLQDNKAANTLGIIAESRNMKDMEEVLKLSKILPDIDKGKIHRILMSVRNKASNKLNSRLVAGIGSKSKFKKHPNSPKYKNQPFDPKGKKAGFTSGPYNSEKDEHKYAIVPMGLHFKSSDKKEKSSFRNTPNSPKYKNQPFDPKKDKKAFSKGPFDPKKHKIEYVKRNKVTEKKDSTYKINPLLLSYFLPNKSDIYVYSIEDELPTIITNKYLSIYNDTQLELNNKKIGNVYLSFYFEDLTEKIPQHIFKSKAFMVQSNKSNAQKNIDFIIHDKNSRSIKTDNFLLFDDVAKFVIDIEGHIILQSDNRYTIGYILRFDGDKLKNSILKVIDENENKKYIVSI